MLEYSWFKMLYLFQVHSDVIQLYIYVYVFQILPLKLLQNRVPVLNSRSFLLIYFIYSSVYMLIPNI